MFLIKKKLMMLLFLIFSIGQASQLINWTFPSDIEMDEERKIYFMDKINRKAKGELMPDVVFHVGSLAGENCGYNFPYHGPIEQIAYRIMEVLDYPGRYRKAVVLGCGNGRNGFDILYKTKRTEVVFIDKSSEQINILNQAVRVLNLPQNRIITACEDAKEFVNIQSENSVDYYYVANLIHYFRYDEIRKLLQDMFRTSKKGYVFLTFHGYDPDGIYDAILEQEDSNIFYQLTNKTNVDDPCYVESIKMSRPSIQQIAELASKVGFHIGYAKYFYREAITATLSYLIDNSIERVKVSCDYKFEPGNGTSRKYLPVCQMILTKLD